MALARTAQFTAMSLSVAILGSILNGAYAVSFGESLWNPGAIGEFH